MTLDTPTPTAVLQYERRGSFWFARLNRPGQRNSLTEDLITGLALLCDDVSSDLDARALVLWGAGGHFCAGADFGRFLELMAGAPGAGVDPIITHNRGFGALLERIAALPVPTIAVVRGAAMGGGCGLAATCDHVIAAEDAVFAMPEVTLGVAPAQIAPFVMRRVGTSSARWSMLTAARLHAQDALATGLADRVVAIADLAVAVRATLESLAVAEPAALRATKRIVHRCSQGPLPEALDDAAREFAGLLRHGAAREGIAASRERRAPQWRALVPELPDFT